MKSFIQFWDEFIQVWYEWIQDPDSIDNLASDEAKKLLEYYQQHFPKNNAKNLHLEIPHEENGKNLSVVLEPNELPEPYLKSDESVKFIIINLNPGGTADAIDENDIYADSDGTKMISNNNKGALLQKFVDKNDCSCKYSEYVNKYSPLAGSENSSNKHVVGYDWWNIGKKKDKDNATESGGRMRWIKDFYSLYGKEKFSNENVLALELCPFHSKKWNDDVILKMPQEIIRIIKKYIYIPALKLAKENNIPVITCIGKNHCAVIEYLFWAEYKDKKEAVIDNRHYVLYVLKNYKTNILVTYAPGSNNAPAKEFKEVENMLLLRWNVIRKPSKKNK